MAPAAGMLVTALAVAVLMVVVVSNDNVSIHSSRMAMEGTKVAAEGTFFVGFCLLLRGHFDSLLLVD